MIRCAVGFSQEPRRQIKADGLLLRHPDRISVKNPAQCWVKINRSGTRKRKARQPCLFPKERQADLDHIRRAFGYRAPYGKACCNLGGNEDEAFDGQRTVKTNFLQTLECVGPIDGAASRHATVAFGHVDVAQMPPGVADALRHAGLFDVHVVGVQMDKDIVRAGLFNNLWRRPRR
jgi:hypothetical protein